MGSGVLIFCLSERKDLCSKLHVFRKSRINVTLLTFKVVFCNFTEGAHKKIGAGGIKDPSQVDASISIILLSWV